MAERRDLTTVRRCGGGQSLEKVDLALCIRGIRGIRGEAANKVSLDPEPLMLRGERRGAGEGLLNAKRSHAGPLMTDVTRDDHPALADASGSLSC
jgi:hypothetical protein